MRLFLILFIILSLSISGSFYEINSIKDTHLDAVLNKFNLIYFVIITKFLFLFLISFFKKNYLPAIIISVPFLFSFWGTEIIASAYYLLSIPVSFHFFKNRLSFKNLNKISIYVLYFCLVMFLINIFSVTTAIWYKFDFYIFKSLFQELTLTNSEYILREVGLNYTEEIFYSFRYLLFAFYCIFIGHFYSTKEIVKSFLIAASIYAIILPLFLFFQIGEYHPVFRINQNNFWNFANRYSGLNSDPNAFGIVAGIVILLVPSFLGERKLTWSIAISLLVSISALWSGSRTFFIFFFTSILYHLYLSGLSNKLIKLRTVISAVLVLFILSLIVFLYSPPSIERLSDSFQISNLSKTLNSRVIFSKLAWYAAVDSPSHGLGTGRFISEQGKIAKKYDINLGDWRDNANNWFLQIAVNSGIPSLIIVLIFLLLSFKLDLNSAYESSKTFLLIKIFFLVFFISLLLGPHLHFLDVKILLIAPTAYLISLQGNSGHSFSKYYKYIIFLLLLVFVFCTPWKYKQNLPQGLYQKEYYEDECLIWTSKYAKIQSKKEQKYIYIKDPLSNLRNTSGEIIIENLSVINKSSKNIVRKIKLDESIEWNKLNIEPGSILKLTLPFAQSPYKLGISSDKRVLGVQLKCEL